MAVYSLESIRKLIGKYVIPRDGTCIAVIHRLDDEDDKLVVALEGGMYSGEQGRGKLTHSAFGTSPFRGRMGEEKATQEAMVACSW